MKNFEFSKTRISRQHRIRKIAGGTENREEALIIGKILPEFSRRHA